jgi:hypothetical protein
MKISIWTRTDDLGDGSSTVTLHATELAARKDLDEDGFDTKGLMEMPCEIDCVEFDIGECSVLGSETGEYTFGKHTFLILVAIPVFLWKFFLAQRQAIRTANSLSFAIVNDMKRKQK